MAGLEEKAAVVRRELECQVCLSLICEPVTLPCGHTFCRACLLKSLTRDQRKCPSCRTACFSDAAQIPENIVLKNIAEVLFSDEYSTRLNEVKEGNPSPCLTLPAFLSNEYASVGSLLQLYLYEHRYRLLARRIVNSSRAFAYIPRGFPMDGDVALVAILEHIEFMADGRAVLEAKIVSRNLIKSTYVDEGTYGLSYVELSPLIDEPMQGDAMGAAVILVAEAMSVVSEEMRIHRTHCGDPPVSNPELLSLWLLNFGCMSASEKLALLRSRDTLERLKVGIQSALFARARGGLGRRKISLLGHYLGLGLGCSSPNSRAIIALNVFMLIFCVYSFWLS